MTTLSNSSSKSKLRLVLALILGSLPGHLLALNTFPIATNPGIIEFSGGPVVCGTNYLVGLISGANVASQRISGTGQLLGTATTIGANPGFPPAAVFTAGKSKAFAAWSDTTISFGVNMFGQLLASDGSKIGSAFPLLGNSGTHGPQSVQAAASDGTNFLVVWKDAANNNLYGQMVAGAGALSGAEFVIYASAVNFGERNLGLTFGKDNYLCAWQSSLNGQEYTYAKTISPGGVTGGLIQVSETPSLDRNPLAVSFDGTNFFVVWNRDSQVTGQGRPVWTLCGRFLSPAGIAQGSDLVLVTEQASFPALAFDGANYLLAWGYNADTPNSDRTIHAQFLDRAGNPTGPVITPFSTQGTNPPLLPLNGLAFDGNRLLLTATFGSFVLGANGDVMGFVGGDVFGTFIPRSTTPPVFANATISGGKFQGELRGAPGQTYTIEISPNLTDWMPVGLVSSDSSEVIPLQDDRPLTGSKSQFYRSVIGNTLRPSFDFNFLEFVNAGGFSGRFTPSVSFPVALNSYSARFSVQNEKSVPAATNVFFTGPAGSGLSNTAAEPLNSYVGFSEAGYQAPVISSPTIAPPGVWIVKYQGTNISFNMPDTLAASRVTVPFPTVTVNGDIVQQVTWVYRDAATGAVLAGPPAYVTDIQVEIDGLPGRIYESPTLTPGTLAHTLTTSVSWSAVHMLHLAYDDSLGNRYVISFTKP